MDSKAYGTDLRDQNVLINEMSDGLIVPFSHRLHQELLHHKIQSAHRIKFINIVIFQWLYYF